ncbi:hypothetical protein FGG78_24955 [Thioclava sp. BHET1]|nr:hypothetical protein FGG78_24955 [Thioclava sp. BHET1]
MKRLSCPTCREEVYFPNTDCLNCGTLLHYLPETGEMVGPEAALSCANRESISCNWVAPAPGALCACCAATEVIPDLDLPENRIRWEKLEAAKRRLWAGLIALDLPRDGLYFHFLASGPEPVRTGHAQGCVTIDIAEADDDEREARRVALGEPYRTLLGHLRHETGHFYWDVLVDGGAGHGPAPRADFTAVFGDPDADYQAALKRHYDTGPAPDWPQRHVSAYASAHPWEDFAETWAHYLHMADGIETAKTHAITPREMPRDPHDISAMTAAWIEICIAMNAMNRAMGTQDFYPFVLAPAVVEKLDYIHRLIGRDGG